ncbi:hypothetical protein FHS95_003015 [Sphingomonas naasensis]|uniref:DUF5678 domain-containing protein n=1 Tax=Sphingomonas naasensis TaxID=1344951 RepID=A0A4S1WDI7_9SPHN|nr:hypothetical protein [Sphingomonas naasensis]NIJ21312.1 hypothetical protein [Sphingomonas naasensis]TGX38746.1 hypothetical protein E5A74_18110 [Sphingomonas naasensis]
MDDERLRQEVDANYDAFQCMLAGILASHRDQFALMRDRAVIDYFDKPGEAYREGISRFPDERFSIQEVTDEPIDLGFFSHVAH